jgi:hypothetical protein
VTTPQVGVTHATRFPRQPPGRSSGKLLLLLLCVWMATLCAVRAGDDMCRAADVVQCGAELNTVSCPSRVNTTALHMHCVLATAFDSHPDSQVRPPRVCWQLHLTGTLTACSRTFVSMLSMASST